METLQKKERDEARPDKQGGQGLFNANQLSQLRVSNPHLRGQGIPNAQVPTRDSAKEIFARLPISQDSRLGFVIPPVGGQSMNVIHDAPLIKP
jgi:hypothetical protein